jgi:hypothetical protein
MDRFHLIWPTKKEKRTFYGGIRSALFVTAENRGFVIISVAAFVEPGS